MTLDHEKLESITMNGKDAVLLLLNLTIEIVTAVSPSEKDSENRLIDIANRLEGFARKVGHTQTGFLMGQLSHALIATERTR